MLPFIVLLAVQQSGPAMPVGVAPYLSKLSLSIQKCLQDGKFQEASSLLERWPTGHLAYRAVGLPSAYASAGNAAAAMVAEASGGKVTFVEGESPRVQFRFVPMPAEGPAEPEWNGEIVEMAIPISDRGGDAANERSVVWSMAKGMAYAAGLDHTMRRRSVMGPVAFTKSLSQIAFSLPERGMFAKLDVVYRDLRAAVDEKRRLVPAAPRIVVEQHIVDMGVIIQGDHKEFAVSIKNTGNAPASVEIETTCSCVIATPALLVEPGGSVIVKPKFDSADYQGQIEKHLYVLSNSLENPRETVLLKASIAPEIRFLAPPGATSVRSVGVGADLIQIVVPDAGEAQAELTFYGTKSPVELIDVQLGSPLATATVVPFEGQTDDPLFGPAVRKGAKVLLGFPPSWPFGISWLRVVGVTDSKRKPLAEMTLQVRKGIAVTPQSAYFGDAKVGETSERVVVVDHLTKPFKITKVSTDENISANVTAAGDTGASYRIVIRTTPKSAGPITGSVRLATDSVSQPIIVIPVGGIAK